MTDIEMPDADSANPVESSENMTSTELPQPDPVEPTTETTDEDFTPLEALLADDTTLTGWPLVHPSSANPPSNEEADTPTLDAPNHKSKANPRPLPNFSITKFTGITSWGPRDSIYDSCAICRNHVLDKCINCEIGPPKDGGGCDIAEGLCRHAYHFHCISTWLGKNSVYPLDNSKWNYYKVTAKDGSVGCIVCEV